MTARPATRSSSPAVAHRPWAKPVVLRDGRAVLIRQVQRADAALLADGFAQLSVRSRRLRFMIAKDHLSPSDLRFYTDVDHHDHEALGAVSLTDGYGVGIARYIRNAHDPSSAEIAITVIDAWQGRGLGTRLLGQLIERARHASIDRFTALISADNVAALALLSNVDAGTRPVHRDGDIIECDIALAGYRCALCRTPGDSISGRIETTSERPVRWICHACLRAYLPLIEAKLDLPWWQ